MPAVELFRPKPGSCLATQTIAHLMYPGSNVPLHIRRRRLHRAVSDRERCVSLDVSLPTRESALCFYEHKELVSCCVIPPARRSYRLSSLHRAPQARPSPMSSLFLIGRRRKLLCLLRHRPAQQTAAAVVLAVATFTAQTLRRGTPSRPAHGYSFSYPRASSQRRRATRPCPLSTCFGWTRRPGFNAGDETRVQ
jgi:hypothetical protein